MRVCLDASLVASLVLPEGELSSLVKSHVERWVAQEAEFVAPDLWAYEAVSVVFKAVLRGRLSMEDGSLILDEFLAFPIVLTRPLDYARAYTLALEHHLSAPYDAHYLALAEAEGIEFWTGDKRLYDRVHRALPWVHFVGE